VDTPAGFRFGRDGERAREYAVEMVRLPERDNAVVRLREGRLDSGDVERFAALLATFHEGARRAPEVDAYVTPEAVASLLRTNLEEIEPFVGSFLPREALAAAREHETQSAAALAPAFARRLAARRACDGHGDLQLAHFFVHDPERAISVIDCIEFNEGFRCADAVADVAFLAMDLDRYGRPDLSDYLVARYADLSADHDLYEVLDLYKSYRALVRAKVACLKAREPEVAERDRAAAIERARTLAVLAAAYASPSAAERALVLLAGPPGTGKSTVAWALSRRLGAPVVSTDVVRKALAGMRRTQRLGRALGEGIYAPAMSERVYTRLRELGRTILRSGRTAILDATFPRRQWRAEVAEAGRLEGVPLVIVECRLDREMVERRLAEREADPHAVSDADREIARRLAAGYEPVGDGEAEIVRRVSTDRPVEEIAQELLATSLSRFGNLETRGALAMPR
jgi:aminoglycoside phosphotransferase family enzyme/predicted kinase